VKALKRPLSIVNIEVQERDVYFERLEDYREKRAET